MGPCNSCDQNRAKGGQAVSYGNGKKRHAASRPDRRRNGSTVSSSNNDGASTYGGKLLFRSQIVFIMALRLS